MGEAMHVWGQGTDEKSLYLPCYKPKTALKQKSVKNLKKKKRITRAPMRTLQYKIHLYNIP